MAADRRCQLIACHTEQKLQIDLPHGKVRLVLNDLQCCAYHCSNYCDLFYDGTRLGCSMIRSEVGHGVNYIEVQQSSPMLSAGTRSAVY